MIHMVFMILSQVASLSDTLPSGPAKVVAPPAPSQNGQDIVVLARRVDDTDTLLSRCIARRCPPDEEMIASLKKVDAQFLAGKYEEARRSLKTARDRNGKYAAKYPTLVSELWRADAKLASMLGLRSQSQVAARAATQALREGLTRDDPRILVQQLEAGDALAMESRNEEAAGVYDRVAKRARDSGDRTTEGRAMFKKAVLYVALARREPPYIVAANRQLDSITQTTDAAFAPFREAAAVLRTRLNITPKDPAKLDTAIASIKVAGTQPILAYAPPMDLGQKGSASNGVVNYAIGPDSNDSTSVNRVDSGYDLKNQWADISYRVAPDGTVHDVEVVRQGDRSVDDWVGGVRKSIAGRRYVPLATDPAGIGVLRKERFSFVSDIGTKTGSHLRSRTTVPHIEVVDLTGSDKTIRN